MSKKLFIALLSMVVMLAGGAVGYGYNQQKDVQQTFYGDGYVLSLQETAGENVPTSTFFSAGTKYNSSLAGDVSFQDMSGTKESVSSSSFVHYADNSISTLGNGVALRLGDLKNGLLDYYGISEGTIVQKQEDSYLINNGGEPITFQNYVWKVSNAKYLMSAPEMELVLASGEQIVLSEYVEVHYIEDGIVQIINNDIAYQMLSMNAYIQMDDGMSIDLQNKCILQNGEAKLLLDSIALDGKYNIAVAQTEPGELKVPTFDITTIDGQVGNDGDSGDDGEIGETGEAGEIGKTGETGDDGDGGEDGQVGSSGGVGGTGATGNDGDDGSDGSDGATGATGATGSTGDSSSSSTSVIMPVFVLVNFDSTTTSVTGTIQMDSEGQSVTLGDSTVTITNTQTNEVIEVLNLDLSGGFSDLDIDYEGLEVDQTYRLDFTAFYTIDGEETSGERTFISRTFTTTAYGIIESYDYATQESITVDITKKSYSEVTVVDVFCYEEGTDRSDEHTITIEVTFDSAGTENITFNNLDSNTNYIIETCVQDGTSFITVSTNTYTTLKTPPVLSLAPIVAVNPRGYFEVRPDTTMYDGIASFADVDNGIISYRYDVYEWNETTNTVGSFVTSVSADGTSTTSIYADGTIIQRGATYVTKLVVEFYDNEKTVEYSTPFSDSFYIDAQTGVPYMQFIEEEIRYDAIKGNLRFTYNGALIDIDGTKPMRLTMYSDLFGENLLIKYTEDMYGGTLEYFDYELDLNGLKENTTYRFNMYGYYDDDTTESLLATCIVTVPKSDNLTANLSYDEDSQADAALAMSMYFSSGDGIEDTTADQYESKNVAEIDLLLLSGSTKVATTTLQFNVTEGTDGYYTSGFSDYYKSSNENEEDVTKYEVTNTTFGLTSAELSYDEYTIRIEEVRDYTTIADERYEPVQSLSYYNEIELDGANSIDLNKVGTPPMLPETSLEVIQVLKSMLSSYSISSTEIATRYGDLPDDAVVGFHLIPQYDNVSQYAEKYTMYAFQKDTYDAHMNDFDKTNYKLLESGRSVESYTMEDTYETWGDLVPGKLMLMAGDSAEGYPGTVSNGYTYAGLAYEFYSGLDRGYQYVFAYDLEIDCSKGSVDTGSASTVQYYPYCLTDYYYDSSHVLRSEVDDQQCDAPNVAPTFKLYPWSIEEEIASWKIKATDVDDTLATDSMRLYGSDAAGTYVEAMLVTEDEVLEAYQEIEFSLSSLSIGTKLNLYATYTEYENSQQGKEKFVAEQYYEIYESDPDFTLSVSDSTASAAANSLLIDIDGVNPDTYTAFFNQVAGAKITINDAGSTYSVTLNSALTHQNDTTYRVAIPLADLAEFKGKTINVTCQLYATSGAYGYKYLSSGYMYALQTHTGVFYGWTTASDGSLGFGAINFMNGAVLDTMNKTVSIGDDTISMSFIDLMSDQSKTLSLSIGESGATTVLGTSTYAMTPKEVKLSTSKKSGETSFSTVIPTVSNFTSYSGLNQVDCEFDLTDGIESLLDASSQEITFTINEINEDGTSEFVKDVKFTLNDLSDAYQKKYGSSASGYLVTLVGLEKDSTYTVVLKGDLAGDGTTETVTFMMMNSDSELVYNSYNISTMGEVTTSIYSTQIANNYYRQKYLRFYFTTDNYSEVEFCYDVFNTTDLTTDSDGTIQVNEGAEAVYHYDTDSTLTNITVPAIYGETKNGVTIDISPPNETKITMGNSYKVRITVYPNGTDYNSADWESNLVGTQWSSTMAYGAVEQPTASIMTTMSDLNEFGTAVDMDVTVSLIDNSKIVTSNVGFQTNETTSESYMWDFINENEVADEDSSQLYGGYLIGIYKELANGEWELIPQDRFSSYTDEDVQLEKYKDATLQNTLYGLQTIKLTDLYLATQYKIMVYAKKDADLVGGDEEDLKLGTGGRAIIYGDEVSINQEGSWVILVNEVIKETLDSSGLYINDSDIDLEQISETQVQMTLYNAAGLSQIKYMNATFQPTTENTLLYSESTGFLAWDVDAEAGEVGTKVETFTNQLGTETVITFDIGFAITDKYYATINLYGADYTDDPLYTISGKRITISQLATD